MRDLRTADTGQNRERNKMKPTNAICVILALFIFLAAAGCGKGGTAPDEKTEVRILEHVFRGTACSLPDDWELNPAMVPLWDAETEKLTFCAYRSDEYEDENGLIRRAYRTAIFTFSSKVFDAV